MDDLGSWGLLGWLYPGAAPVPVLGELSDEAKAARKPPLMAAAVSILETTGEDP